MIFKEASQAPGRVRVTFELPSSIWAERVNLVGEFNGWDRARTPMRQTGADGSWRITLELAADRDYEFRYLIDGEIWYNDFDADSYIANEYGSDNSVVRATVDAPRRGTPDAAAPVGPAAGAAAPPASPDAQGPVPEPRAGDAPYVPPEAGEAPATASPAGP